MRAETPTRPNPALGSDSAPTPGRPGDPLDLLGARLGGRLAVVRYLGETSSGHVYRVVHTLMDRPCFLKVSPRDPADPDGLPARLRREAQAASRIDHPAVLRPVDMGTHGDWAYLAVQWSDGPSLRSLMDQGRDVPVPQLIAIGLELLEVLCAVHQAGMVLRSFDPRRILVPPGGRGQGLRLFDLSRTVPVGEVGAGEPAEPGRRFATGVVLPSSRYMSPEEIREAPADPRSDLYGFGVLLYEMIAGEYPYALKGKGPTAYMVGHLREQPRPLAAEREVPRDLTGVLERLLAKSPDDRFETAQAARRALEDAVVPDLNRLNTAAHRHVLEAWRTRVRVGMRSTMDEEPLGLDDEATR